MPRRTLALLVGLLGAISFGSCSFVEAEGPVRPDVVLIVVDTLRADRLGCYGYERPTSPNIDALAERGVVFERNTAQSSWTMPSMIALLTGRYVTDYRDRVFEDSPTLAELLKDEGYRTAGVVANGLLRPEHGYGRGFDHYDVHDPREHRPAGNPPYRTAAETVAKLGAVVDELATTGLTGERAPYFLYVHLMDPHAPYLPAPEYDDELPSSGVEPLARAGWHRRSYEELAGAMKPAAFEAGLARLDRERALYDQNVRVADEAVGELLAELERRGLLDRAVIALVSDHGEGLYDHVRPAHEGQYRGQPVENVFHKEHGRSLYQELVATPMILAGRGLPVGQRIDAPVENVDVVPTVLALLGIDVPMSFAGRDLLPTLSGEEGHVRDASYAWVHQAAAILDASTGWKLEVPTGFGTATGSVPMLYHLPSDPLERRNRLTEHPEIALDLEQRLNAWIAAHPTPSSLKQKGDPLVVESLAALGYIDAGIVPASEPNEEPLEPAETPQPAAAAAPGDGR